MRVSDVTEETTALVGRGATGRAPGPGVPRLVLGTRLRRLREAQFITPGEAADAIRVPEARIVEMELGRSGFAARDVADLLTIYGVTEEAARVTLLALAERANAPGWWHAYRDVVPHWLATYLALEQAADVIRGYENQFVPGLLQTEEYARAVVSLGVAGSLDPCGGGHGYEHGIGTRGDRARTQTERRVELRMRRQRILHRPNAPHLWAVIDEAVLRRPVGGTAVLRGQLEHLAAMCTLPHVTVQVLPFRAAARAPASGPVSLVRLDGRELPDVVYLEQYLGAHYPDDPDDIEQYRQLIDQLATLAEPSAQTPAILRRMAAELG